jgi:hypothetical protein
MRAQSILDSPPNLQTRESEIVDAVFSRRSPIRGEPVESCKLRYFNSFEFFDRTGSRLTALMQLSLSKIQTQRPLKQGIHKRFIPTLVIEVYDTCDYQKLERSTKDWMIRTIAKARNRLRSVQDLVHRETETFHLNSRAGQGIRCRQH